MGRKNMFSKRPYEEVQKMVQQTLSEDQGQMLAAVAEQLDLTEGEVTLALPEEMILSIDGEHAQTVLQQLPSWGKVTTIIHSFGSIFEFKNPFPKGQFAHGYFNIMGKEGLHGHLLVDSIKHIAFVSKPFRTMESHYIGFFTANGDCVFKVYLGRDKKRQLIPEQIEMFNTLKQEYKHD